jgi:hypothetical protein
VRRFTALLLLLAPLLWITWGWEPLPPDLPQALLQVSDRTAQIGRDDRAKLGPFRPLHLWHITSPSLRFGGYSALLAMPEGDLLALSDRNSWGRFAVPAHAGRAKAKTGRLIYERRRDGSLSGFDVESAVLDPADGSLWVGAEGGDRVFRLARRGLGVQAFTIGPMKAWPRNGGAEAMARLRDGRWMILCESCALDAAGAHLGLLFSGHPGRSPLSPFRIVLPAGFDPVDMTPLPDGRLLILTRRLNFLPLHFESRIVLADPAQIDRRRALRTIELARIDGQKLRENYEGMALRPGKGGQMMLWLISDANDSAFQRTLLLELAFDPSQFPPIR